MAKEIWDWMGKGQLILEVEGGNFKCVKDGGFGWRVGQTGEVEDTLESNEWVVTTQGDIEKGKDLLQKIDDTIESVMQEQAMRKNEGKPQLSYVLDVMPALKDMVAVMEFGAEKYERNNWQKGFPKDKLLDSMLRHIDAFYSGEDVDPESGLPHVGHIMCNAAFLAYHFGSNSKYWEDKDD